MAVASSPPIAISMGEPAGIGPDLMIKLYSRRVELDLPPFVVFGNIDLLQQRAEKLGIEISIQDCAPEDVSNHFATRLPVKNITGKYKDSPGKITEKTAPLVIASINEAVTEILQGKCRALVTAPIHKAALYGAGFEFPGHTEFLASLCKKNGNVPTPVMMLAHDDLRAVPLTIHVPLRDVPGLIDKELIIKCATIVVHDLKRKFDIPQPKLAIAGLNPHAGEGGTMGTEDKDIIAPAVSELQSNGIDAVGPLPGDTLFYPPHWRKFDAVIAMYHDQALIPVKTLAFDEGVNITLGLPIVRTSPDHGTALDMAGTGKASVSSMLAAIRMADRMSGEGK